MMFVEIQDDTMLVFNGDEPPTRVDLNTCATINVESAEGYYHIQYVHDGSNEVRFE